MPFRPEWPSWTKNGKDMSSLLSTLPAASECLYCGRPLPPGRPDRKFCSALCRSRYHNAVVGRYTNYRLRVISALDRNHRILQGLVDGGIRSVSRVEALTMGFQPDYFTGCNQVRCHVEYVCFDIRYFLSANRLWGIVRFDPLLSGG